MSHRVQKITFRFTPVQPLQKIVHPEAAVHRAVRHPVEHPQEAALTAAVQVQAAGRQAVHGQAQAVREAVPMTAVPVIRIRMAEMIQADWAKVGVQAKIVTYEWGEYLKRAKDGEHQTVMMGWTGDNGDPDNFFATLFSCAASEQGSNYSKWCYKPFEDLIQPARATDDHNKRVELYKQAQVVMHDQAPALIIAHSTVFEPVRKEVKGYVVDPLGKHHFENVSIE